MNEVEQKLYAEVYVHAYGHALATTAQYVLAQGPEIVGQLARQYAAEQGNAAVVEMRELLKRHAGTPR